MPADISRPDSPAAVTALGRWRGESRLPRIPRSRFRLRHLHRLRIVKVAQAAALVMAIGWLALRGADSMGYNWQWNRIPSYLYDFEDGRFVAGPLLLGAVETLVVSGWGLLLALGLGLGAAILRLA